MGLVSGISNNEILENLKGPLRIGHVRYLTAGESFEFSTQPPMVFAKNTTTSLAHNGSPINYQVLRTRLEEDGMMF